MKERIDRYMEIIETTVFLPLRFEEMVTTFKKDLYLLEKIISFFAAISIAVGAVYLTPPYTGSSGISLLVSFVILFLFLETMPGFLGAFLDFSVRLKKERKEHSIRVVHASKIFLVIFALFAPFAVILVQANLSGGMAYFMLLVSFISLYVYLLGNLCSVLYELKISDTMAISFRAFLTLMAFPVLFDFAFGHSLVTLIK